jgi:hypothetical protein
VNDSASGWLVARLLASGDRQRRLSVAQITDEIRDAALVRERTVFEMKSAVGSARALPPKRAIGGKNNSALQRSKKLGGKTLARCHSRQQNSPPFGGLSSLYSFGCGGGI